jgi:hypothetical protein
MRNIPYAPTIRGLMYAQVGMCLNLAFGIKMFGRYQKKSKKAPVARYQKGIEILTKYQTRAIRRGAALVKGK